MTSPVLSMPFAVPGLTRDEKHVYGYSDGTTVWHPIPSVTSIIKLIDKSGPLVGWAKRETAASAVRNLDALAAMRKEGGDKAAIDWLKTIPDYQRDRAADRGTSIHRIVEQIIRGQTPEIPEELGPYVVRYLDWVREWNPKFVAVEQMVCSLKHNYAGTFDFFAVIDGESWLCDIKTGGAYFETGLQLAAYAAADFMGRPGDPKKYKVPRATKFGVLLVKPDQPTVLIPYAVDKDTFRAFLSARKTWEWTQGPATSIVGKPLTKETAAA